MKKRELWLPVTLVLCLAIAIVFGVPGIISYGDKALGNLISETVPRLSIGIFLIILMCVRGYKSSFLPKWSAWHLLWCLPCLLVAIVNFPFTALIFGDAHITRADLLWLFLIKCLAIAVLEEVFFRALLVPAFLNRFEGKKYCVLITVVITSALFALMHIINLFFGAGIGYTALQVGYTFLIGCMLAVTLMQTKNIWLCVFIHALFDVGGTIVTDLGSGYFQDMTFWILTAVAGVICFVHILLTLKKLMNPQGGEQHENKNVD